MDHVRNHYENHEKSEFVVSRFYSVCVMHCMQRKIDLVMLQAGLEGLKMELLELCQQTRCEPDRVQFAKVLLGVPAVV